MTSVFATDASPALTRRRRRFESTRLVSIVGTVVALAAVLGMLGLFAVQSLPVLEDEGLGYVTGDRWFYRSHTFGALPMIYGTAAVSFVALVLAVPVGLGAAVFASEYLPGRARLALKVTIELLAGVPSVVYGLLGILFLREFVYVQFESFDVLSGDTLLTAGLLLAVMILPTMCTLADDAFRAVPHRQRLAARGLGLSRSTTILSIVIPQASRGLVAAALLSLGRAMGETIAVFLVVGRQDNNLPTNPLSLRALLEPGQTLTTKLGGAEVNIAVGDPLHWAAVVGLGLLLMAMVLVLTLAGGWLETRSVRESA